uniref:FTH domain-containing protein n=1 Tax=Heterorhabditis bacteriophora TaxID=37862 RepID=A0A1I7WR01_HETBA
MINYGEVSESEKRYRKLCFKQYRFSALETFTFVVLDQPPVKDYDFYMELFGDSGKDQTSTQTGEDDMNEEVQTEEQSCDTKWVQHPAQKTRGTDDIFFSRMEKIDFSTVSQLCAT